MVVGAVLRHPLAHGLVVGLGFSSWFMGKRDSFSDILRLAGEPRA